jgi:hypothetical protein
MTHHYKTALKVTRGRQSVCISVPKHSLRLRAGHRLHRKYAGRHLRKRGAVTKCSRKRSRKVCLRLAHRKCLSRRGGVKKSRICRSLSRRKGLGRKSYHRIKHRALSRSGSFFGMPYSALKLRELD